MPEEYYLNAGFDTGLGSGKPMPPAIQRYVEELGIHYLFAAPPDGSVIVHPRIPEDFFQYTEDSGLSLPKVKYYPDNTPGSVFVPFGWDGLAVEMSRSYAINHADSHPSLETVKRVNSKQYSVRLAEVLEQGKSKSIIFSCDKKILEFLSKHPDDEWLLKTEHGNSGTGHKRIRKQQSLPQAWIEQRSGEGQAIILEPWFHRCLDIATTFQLSKTGEVKQIAFHEIINTAEGAFTGIVMEKDNGKIREWKHCLSKTAEQVGHALFRDGYYGPVSLDSFVWMDGKGKKRIRKLVEINARLWMGLPIHRLSEQLTGAKCLLWRLFAGNKLYLHEDYTKLKDEVDGFIKQRGRSGSVTVLSPLTIIQDGNRKRPKKVGILFTGSERAQVEELERDFTRFFS
jgi:hypothetical protein